METRRPQGGVFSYNFEFFQFSRVDREITIKIYNNTRKITERNLELLRDISYFWFVFVISTCLAYFKQ